MGMFDSFRSEHPDVLIGYGQTKSFHCLLDEYILTKEGRLIRNYIENWRDGEDTPPEDTNYHGTITVLDVSSYVDFELTFTKGQLVLVQEVG